MMFRTKLPSVKQGFFCTPLRTGTLLIAWYFLISSLMSVLTISMVASVAWLVQGKDKNDAMLMAFVKIVLLLVTVVQILLFAPSIMLLVGVYRGILKFVKAWVIVNFILFFFGLIGGMIGCIVVLAMKDKVLPSSHPYITVFAIVVAFVNVLVLKTIYAYIIIMVKSYYVELVDNSEEWLS